MIQQVAQQDFAHLQSLPTRQERMQAAFFWHESAAKKRALAVVAKCLIWMAWFLWAASAKNRPFSDSRVVARNDDCVSEKVELPSTTLRGCSMG
jgi:hypothetical protein